MLQLVRDKRENDELAADLVQGRASDEVQADAPRICVGKRIEGGFYVEEVYELHTYDDVLNTASKSPNALECRAVKKTNARTGLTESRYVFPHEKKEFLHVYVQEASQAVVVDW